MAAPFPGMDPFLEADAYWPLLHHQLILGVAERLQASLEDRFRLRFGTRHFDVQLVLFTSIAKERHRETFIEIRQSATDRLLTHIEFISPANRLTDVGRQCYQQHREQTLQQQVQLVEIDLILRGQPVWPCRSVGTDHEYTVLITQPQRTQIEDEMRFSWHEPLPRVRIPLSCDERSVVIDLQDIFTKIYERYFDGQVDYTVNLPIELKADDQAWVQACLQNSK